MSDRNIRVTVTLEPHLAAYAERLVAAGQAPSVSAVVNGALEAGRQRDQKARRLWREAAEHADPDKVARMLAHVEARPRSSRRRTDTGERGRRSHPGAVRPRRERAHRDHHPGAGRLRAAPVIPALAIVGASLDLRSDDTETILHGLERLGSVMIAPLRDAEQAVRLAAVIARTGSTRGTLM